MAEKVTFDGINKLIIVNDGETELDAQRDVYSAWKRWLIEQDSYGSTSKYPQALRTVGGDTITATESVSPYFFLLNGWVLRPYEGDHLLTVNGNLFVDGGGNPFTPTVSAHNVTINLITSSKSITTTINVSGGTLLTDAESAYILSLPSSQLIANDVWSETLTGARGPNSAEEVLLKIKQLVNLIPSMV
jgi:hypothetical protein